MTKPSTTNLTVLPTPEQLKQVCKSICALEAIICPDGFNTYSYNKNWSETEEVCIKDNQQGDHIFILFSPDGVVINGFAHESEMSGWNHLEGDERENFYTENFDTLAVEEERRIWKGVVDQTPKVFHEFIHGEPVASTGTTFCIWQTKSDKEWQIGNINFPTDDYKDGSDDLLELLDGKPLTYQDWAEYYFDDVFTENHRLDIELVKKIFDNHPLTLEIAQAINPNLKDFDKLKTKLDEIGYEYKF